MAFGVLEPAKHSQPRSTVLLESLQQSSSRHGEELLVPKPSNTPRDPLNWILWRKELGFAAIVLGSSATGVMGPVLVPGFNIIAADQDINLTQVTLLNGSLVMALGVSAYLCNSLATVYGTRLIFLFTTVLMLAACCWGAAARSYGSLIGARIVQGMLMSKAGLYLNVSTDATLLLRSRHG
jgi:MFS family permease